MRPLRRLIPVRLRPVVRLPWRTIGFGPSFRLGCVRSVRFGPTRFRAVRLRPVVWLRCRRPVRLRPFIRLSCGRTIRFGPARFRTIGLRPVIRLRRRGTIGISSVCFRPIIPHRLVRTRSSIFWLLGWSIARRPHRGSIRWWIVRSPCGSGGYNSAVVKHSRLRSCRDLWGAMVYCGA